MQFYRNNEPNIWGARLRYFLWVTERRVRWKDDWRIKMNYKGLQWIRL
jgi:hypothetical protein